MREIPSILLRGAEGDKQATLSRYPSNDDWFKRQKARKTIIMPVGRRVTQTESKPSPETDLEIYQHCKSEESPGLSGYEAVRLLDAISQCTVTGVDRAGRAYEVAIRSIWGEEKVTVRIPTDKALFDYNGSAYRLLDLPYGQTEVRINMKYIVDWVTPLMESGSDLPAPHKLTIANAVVTELRSDMEGDGSDLAGDF